ncbi:hypothetical protein [Arthrobacter sp. MMS18-M83]|uniref:hypothetical protein n=1 Tax=Arthrobacter sp. MMS18-M83 TaxID=2996261 RepID=UPI00227C5EAC|nr:hypothetical protein [Arthrobacter sp. MMS18-M83]WAH96548.1 hypothetical protein OW521_19425 [Arthrobacter sp. MMS18-M83]
MPETADVLGLGANLDGQQWIWVALVIIGAAVVAAVMVFGRQRRTLLDRKSTPKHREQDAGYPLANDGGKGDEPEPRHPES